MNDAGEVLQALYDHIQAAEKEAEGGAAEALNKVGTYCTHLV